MNSTQLRTSGVVLIANGFEEQSAVGCIHTLREAGVSVCLVGLTAGPVTGGRGIVLQPDLSLDQVVMDSSPLLAVLPGGRRCIAALLTDPRVHHLLERIATAGGRVALLGSVGQDLEQLLPVPAHQLDAQSLSEFLAALLSDLPNQTGIAG